MVFKTVRATAQGDVAILPHCSAACIRQYAFDAQFGSYARFKSLYTRRDSLEAIAGRAGAAVCLAVVDDRAIVGFGVLCPPGEGDRWAQMAPGVMLEVAALEVTRSWRKTGLARTILQALLEDPALARKIVYMVGYAWTWDLDGSGKTAQEYRNMLIDLFSEFGFQEFETNEPNICLKPENLFMGRIGASVSDTTRKHFKWLRFGIPPAVSDTPEFGI